jgi:thymidylate synthase
MLVFDVRNVHEALPKVVQALLLKKNAVKRNSRNGEVLVFKEPVTTVYRKPTERVLFYPDRDANPFFHFMESLWMLAGRKDVEMPATYVKNIKNFSDDGIFFNAAYGHRLIKQYSKNQLKEIIDILKNDPDSRQAVAQIWSHEDLLKNTKDKPCNLMAVFSINCENKVDMIVYNRSNDIVWGAYGANAVHFSYFHEYVAAGIGKEVGVYRQVSNNLHAYLDTLEKVKNIGEYEAINNPYSYPNGLKPFPLVNSQLEHWELDLKLFMDDAPCSTMNDRFFTRVAYPIKAAHKAYKNKKNPKRFSYAIEIMEQCLAEDWRKACIEWLQRREQGAK